jgi:HSP20 family protein
MMPWSRDYGGHSLWNRDWDDPDRYFGNFFEGFPFSFGNAQQMSPRVDVFQTDRDVVLKAEIPGVTKDDLDIYIDENSVRLSGRTRKNDEYKENDIYRTERYYGSFSRTIPLPSDVKSGEAKAEYRDGILTLTVPKEEQSKLKGHRVDIQ